MTALIDQELKARGIAQVIVVVKSPPSAAAALAAPAMAAAPAALTQHFVTSERSQDSALVASGVVRLEGAQAAGAAADAGLALAGALPAPPPVRYYESLGILLGTVDQAGFAALSQNPGVESVTGAPPISLIRPTKSVRARTTAELTWGLRSLRVPALWAQGFTGKGILVGHLDTGVDDEHPALKEAIAKFAEFDFLGNEINPTPKAHDTDDHGTHTAATIAGRPVSGRHVGVAPEAALASAIVIEGGNVIARILGGMNWAVRNGVRILNMSLGLRGFWEDFLPVTQVLRARNILPVFAVGNEFAGASRSPGNYAEALSVGAHERGGQVADFSCSDRFDRVVDPIVPDLVAPGVNIISARPGGGYQSMDGTSMATPHIAGLAALLMQAKPDKSAAEIETAIFQSCKLKPGMLPDRANRGVPDAVDALALL